MKVKVIIYHVSIVNRSRNKSVVRSAAYCGRSKLYSYKTRQTYDYTHRCDLIYHEIILPEQAPESFQNQENLWNSVEIIEKNKNSQLARSICFAIPKEFNNNKDIQIEMVCKYVQEYFVKYGMCADISIHDKGDKNPHVHLLLTTRSLDSNGEWMKKQQKNYLRDNNGEKIWDFKKQQYKLGKSLKFNNWDERERMEEWRKGWADICNLYFKEHNIPVEMTHMSYKRQNLDIKPTKHLGPKRTALENKGIATKRGNENRRIQAHNQKKLRQLILDRDFYDRDDDDRSR